MLSPKLKYFLLLMSIFLFFNCNTKEENKHYLKAYYFPVDDLGKSWKYVYHPTKAEYGLPETWTYKSIEEEGSIYLESNYMDSRGIVKQYSKEKVVKNGTLIKAYELYHTDSLGRKITQEAIPEQGDYFPFEVSKEGGMFLFKMKYTLPQDTLQQVSMVRNRYFRDFGRYEFDGKTYETAIFDVVESIETTHQIEGDFDVKVEKEEIYAKGIGLVKYKQVVNGGFTIEYELKELVK